MNRREVKKAPVLRFKGFTNDWEQRKFENLVSRLSKTSNNESLPNVTYDDIKSKENSLNKDITELTHGKKGIHFNKDDILFGKLRPYLGNILLARFNGIAVGDFWVLSPKDNNISSFLFDLIQTSKYKYISNLSSGSKMPRSDWNLVSKASFWVPIQQEQNKIGKIFQLIDNLVSLQQRKLDILIKLNRNIIINLFKEIRVNHHAIELKHTASNWKSARLKELGICQSGFGFPIKEQNGSKGIPFFKVSDFNTFGNEIYLQYANNYVTNHQIRKNKWKIFDQVPAIVFAKVGAAIFLNRKRMINEPFLIDNNLMAFELNRQKLDYKFAKILFDNMYLPKFAQVGALPSYNASDINAIKVKIPDMDSQKKIANIIMKNNNEIILQKQILQKGKELKQFLLQNMFI